MSGQSCFWCHSSASMKSRLRPPVPYVLSWTAVFLVHPPPFPLSDQSLPPPGAMLTDDTDAFLQGPSLPAGKRNSLVMFFDEILPTKISRGEVCFLACFFSGRPQRPRRRADLHRFNCVLSTVYALRPTGPAHVTASISPLFRMHCLLSSCRRWSRMRFMC